MTDADLVRYCELHCETERALFSGKHINRMLALAGHPEGFVQEVPEDEFISAKDNMAYLCMLARQRMHAAATTSTEGR